MWVETTDGRLVNLARYELVFVAGDAVTAENDAAFEGGDCRIRLHQGKDATAALRRIRDALARGEQFLSLRETEPPTRLFGPEAAYALERLAHGKEVCGLTVDEAECLAMDAADESIRVRTRVDASNPDLRCVEPW